MVLLHFNGFSRLLSSSRLLLIISSLTIWQVFWRDTFPRLLSSPDTQSLFVSHTNFLLLNISDFSSLYTMESCSLYTLL